MGHRPSEDLRTVVLLERETGAILEQAIAKDPPRFLPSIEDVGHHPALAGDEGGTGQDSGDWVLRQRQRHCLGFECLEHRTNSAPQAASLLIEKPSNWVSSPGELKLRAFGMWATNGRGGVARRWRPLLEQRYQQYRLTVAPAGCSVNFTQESNHL